jgi:hypothetical protein
MDDPTQHNRNRVALLRVLFWLGLAVVLFLAAAVVESL